MANPFIIDPTAGYDPNAASRLGQSLSGLGQVLGERRDKQAALDKQNKMQADMDAVMKSGDPAKVADFMRKNPEQADIVKQSMDAEGEMVREDATSFLSDILTTPEEQWLPKLKQRIDTVEGRGGDPKHSLKLIEAFGNSPENAKKIAETLLAMTDQDAFDSYESTKEEFQMGTGAMSGYTFNKDTGKYSIDPEVKQRLEQKAISAAQKAGKLDIKVTRDINKDVTGLLKGTKDIYGAAKSLETLKASSSPVSQLAAVFKLMKALDPASVVREGEQQQARSTGGPADALVGYINKIKGEGALPPNVFTDMVDTAKRLANSSIDAASDEVGGYLDAYEDKLQKSFKDRLVSRIPARFEVEDLSPPPVDTGITPDEFKLKSKEEQAQIISELKAKAKGVQ